MCGICGILYCGEERHVQRDTLAQMNAQIVHRGPDDDGFFVEGNVGLAMRRLSIIDIRTGQQPISNEDESLWIVYNGEIYNHRDLRSKLGATVIARKAILKRLSICMKSTAVTAFSICMECSLSPSGIAGRGASSSRVTGWGSSLSIIFTTARSLSSALRSRPFSPTRV